MTLLKFSFDACVKVKTSVTARELPFSGSFRAALSLQYSICANNFMLARRHNAYADPPLVKHSSPPSLEPYSIYLDLIACITTAHHS